MSPRAYSYIRFSTPEQMYGDTLRRQRELSEEYAKKNGLVLDNQLKMDDRGISAFKSANASVGALGAFLKAVEQGRVAKGSYLLVESLDRLSRDKVATALKLFLSILENDIVIVTLSDGQKYEQGTLDTQQLIISILIMSRAHEESAIKSHRIGQAWKNKILKAKDR